MEDEAEVEALLKQIALAKQKELSRRSGSGTSWVSCKYWLTQWFSVGGNCVNEVQGALWSREEQTQKQLLEVRRAKEQLETQKKEEEEKLAKLSSSLKEEELKFRKAIHVKPSPFQQAATSVVSTGPNTPQAIERSHQNENANTFTQSMNAIDSRTAYAAPAPPSPPVRSAENGRGLVNNQEASAQQPDALQHLIRNINCDEQEKRVERRQAELEKANSRRREVDFDLIPVGMAGRTKITSDDLSSSYPGSQTHESRQTAAARKAVNKFTHGKPLEGPALDVKVSQGIIAQPEEHVSMPTTQPVAIPAAPPAYPQQFIAQNYPQSSISPYSVFVPPIAPVNPYGFSVPSPYFPGCPYPATSPWFLPGVMSPYQIGSVPLTEHSPAPALRHQEEEIHRLERELEMHRIANEEQAEAKEFAALQGRLQELQIKISTLTPETSSTVSNDDVDIKGDSTLKSLKVQHLESLAKVRNERDLLEEQEKLEELKEIIQRRREEKKRELDHEDWVAKQKRELVTFRLQRAIQQGNVKSDALLTEFQEESSELYKPENGFVLFWDYAAGLPTTANDLQITYAVFEGKLIRTSFKVVSAKESRTIAPQHKLCMLLSSRHVKKLSAVLDLRVIMEVATVSQRDAGGPRIPTSLGWTALNIFKLQSEGELALAYGYFKLPVKQSTMPDPSKTLVLPPTISDCGGMRIHIRLVQGERVDEASRLLVDPELHAARYQLPLSTPQTKGSMSRRPSLQGQRTPNDKSAPTPRLDDRKLASSSAYDEWLSDPPPPTLLHKQDFLDVDRLRLLSSAPSRPAVTRPRSNIPSTGD